MGSRHSKLSIFLIFFLTLLASVAGAVDWFAAFKPPGVAALEQAIMANHCRSLRTDPNCPPARRFLEQNGMSTVDCVKDFNEAGCDSFFREYPEFASQRATCSPYEVCKRNLNLTFLEGCAQYGLKEASAFSQIAANLDVRKLLARFIVDRVSSLNPTYALQKNLAPAKAFLEGLESDRRRLRSLACLDSVGQSEFVCYAALKYGLMVTGTGGAARTAASFALRMRSVEAKLARASVTRETPVAQPRVDAVAEKYRSQPRELTDANFSDKAIRLQAEARYKQTGEEVLVAPERTSAETLLAQRTRVGGNSFDNYLNVDRLVNEAAYLPGKYPNYSSVWIRAPITNTQSPIKKMYGDDATRELFWTTRSPVPDAIDGMRYADTEGARIAVNSVKGQPKSLEVISKDAQTGEWKPFFYVRVGDRWVQSRTFRGVPIERACISCHRATNGRLSPVPTGGIGRSGYPSHIQRQFQGHYGVQ